MSYFPDQTEIVCDYDYEIHDYPETIPFSGPSFCQAFFFYHSCGCRIHEPFISCRPDTPCESSNICKHPSPTIHIARLPNSCHGELGSTPACYEQDPGTTEFVRECDTAESLDLVKLDDYPYPAARAALPLRAKSLDEVVKHYHLKRGKQSGYSANAAVFVPASLQVTSKPVEPVETIPIEEQEIIEEVTKESLEATDIETIPAVADTHSEDSKTESVDVEVESTKAESAEVESIEIESIQVEDVKAESVKAESVKAESVKAESVKAESVKAESINNMSIHDEITDSDSEEFLYGKYDKSSSAAPVVDVVDTAEETETEPDDLMGFWSYEQEPPKTSRWSSLFSIMGGLRNRQEASY
ncbi:hypothetical protein GGR57DRAFT_204555 [Xylariaceae sp. FL1272]|nr:hypothetical protein GGR57DRAFT_204555 [Xylariaceae sp. FL1272]